MPSSPARRRTHHGELPLEWWLVFFTIVTLLLAANVVKRLRPVLLRRRARRWPVVDALVTQDAARDGSPLLRYRTPDGVQRSVPAVEGRRGIEDLPSGSTVRVHVDPRDPQRAVPEPATRDLGLRALWRPGAALAGLLVVDAWVLHALAGS